MDEEKKIAEGKKQGVEQLVDRAFTWKVLRGLKFRGQYLPDDPELAERTLKRMVAQLRAAMEKDEAGFMAIVNQYAEACDRAEKSAGEGGDDEGRTGGNKKGRRR
jgi:hypothetical protein